MEENSQMTKYGIDLIIFMGISYTAVWLVGGGTSFGHWPAAGSSPFAGGIPVISWIIGGMAFFFDFLWTIFDLFTFNITGMPTEIRLILTPLYAGMTIFCIIVFFPKIVHVYKLVMNFLIDIFNFTLGNIPWIGKIPYHYDM